MNFEFPVTVKVTEDDIKNGLRNDPLICPVAKAISRTFKKSVRVIIYTGSTYIMTDHQYDFIYHHSPELTQWIRDFDNGINVPPIEFQIDKIYPI